MAVNWDVSCDVLRFPTLLWSHLFSLIFSICSAEPLLSCWTGSDELCFSSRDILRVMKRRQQLVCLLWHHRNWKHKNYNSWIWFNNITFDDTHQQWRCGCLTSSSVWSSQVTAQCTEMKHLRGNLLDEKPVWLKPVCISPLLLLG